jgi:ABC-2 type transport system ATP-binding protein
MAYFGELHGLSPADSRARSRAFLARVDLADKANVRLDRLSGGQQQKVQLGVTILHEPPLLILDEPTKGFDPVNRRLLMDIIEERRKAGATVVLVTHQMDEVERICDQILLLKNGRAAAAGSVRDVQRQFGSRISEVEYSGVIESSTQYRIRRADQGRAELELAEGITEAEVLANLLAQGVVVSSFSTHLPSLDDVFLQVYGSELDA